MNWNRQLRRKEHMAEKKYQVFISSTYADLIEERKKILDVLLMADCIPAGMEAFVAADTEQFEVIKKVIDLCDYYVLIIGKRYGSIHSETGKSYTEMEYDYAIEHNIPVLVFAIDESVEVEQAKQETDADKILKLQAFRAKAMTNRLVSIWKTLEELTGQLAISIMKAKMEIKRPGWQRAVDFDEATLRREIMELRQENEKVSIKLKEAKRELAALTTPTDVAFEDQEIEIKYHYHTKYGLEHDFVKTNLVKIFQIVSTQMMDVAILETTIENTLKKYFFGDNIRKQLSDEQFVKKMLNQFRALGLVYSQWNNESKVLFWGVTQKGRKVRDDLILLKKN